MIAFICDQCERRVEPQKGTSYPMAPDGWYDVTKRGTYRTLHLCSPKCLLDYTGQQIDAMPNVAAAPEPVACETLGVDEPIAVPPSTPEIVVPTHDYTELRAGMTPESRARVDEQVGAAVKEIDEPAATVDGQGECSEF
jgi:hypothetical protein